MGAEKMMASLTLFHKNTAALIWSAAYIAIAILAWDKLKFGLSFIDEGMYLTDGWRLTAGDNLIPNSDGFVGTFYQVFSAPIFSILPDITILEFRRLSLAVFWLALSFLIMFSTKTLKLERHQVMLAAWPLIYTGSDPLGMTSSLSYYSTTAIIFIFYSISISKLSKSLNMPEQNVDQQEVAKWALVSGIALSLVTISYLPASVTAITFFITILKKKVRKRGKLLILFLIPSSLYLLLIYPNFDEHIHSITRRINGGATPLATPAPFVTQTLGISLGFLLLSKAVYNWLEEARHPMKAAAILAVLICLFINYGWIGSLPDYWNGWFNTPGRLASIFGLASAYFLVKHITSRTSFANAEELLLVNYILISLAFSLTSGLGMLTFLYGAPVFVVYLTIKASKLRSSSILISSISVPIGLALCWHDYNFTYFDRAPKDLGVIIKSGRGAGIHTNEVNEAIIDSIQIFVENNSSPEDFIISFDQTAMTYFLTQRRPALDHSWTGLGGGRFSISESSILEMKRLSRQPKVALHWRNKFLWIPDGPNLTSTALGGTGDSSESQVISYVRDNMNLAGTIDVAGTPVIELYVSEMPGS